MLRNRDVIAILLAVWLTRLAYQQDKTVKAALHLAFYTHATLHAPFDVDGDGTVEALAIITGEKSKRVLEILDLKPLHSRYHSTAAPPFRPKTMLQASINGDAVPLKITTGQIMVSHAPKKKPILVKTTTEYTDRTRHYFCGLDWHDASQKCLQPCPGGTPGECPGEEKCFADTPCDAMAGGTDLTSDFQYQLTPAGGMPSVVTLWSDGTVVLHSVTSALEGGATLELKEMWSHSVALGVDVYDLVLLGDQDFSTGSDSQGRYGIVLVGGTSTPTSVVYALDAMTGQVLWTSSSANDASADTENLPSRGTQSFARRRSRLLDSGGVPDLSLPNCWTMYKHSLLNNLKAYWGPGDAKWHAVHLDRWASKKKKKRKQGRQWHHRHSKLPLHGRPNSLLLRHEGGIQVRSLKNGRSICHLTLSNKVLYSDLNSDGALDQIQAVTTSQSQLEENAAWIANLSSQFAAEAQANRRDGRPRRHHSLCHLLVLSGMPAREQVFASNLCQAVRATEDEHLSAAPPLLTPTGDIVVALSNGLVSKHNSRTGQRMWQTVNHLALPTWQPSSDAAMVSSLFPNQPSTPILISGENMATILTSTQGNILATAAFPQATRSRPIVEDWSGDGTPDVLIQTPDAVWGYIILVRSTGTLSRIMLGLLLVVMLLALLRNRFVNRGGGDRRSTEK